MRTKATRAVMKVPIAWMKPTFLTNRNITEEPFVFVRARFSGPENGTKMPLHNRPFK